MTRVRGGPAPLPASIDLRRAATWFWSDCLTVGGGSSPQTASINSSVETTWLGWSSSLASSIRCLMLPSRSGRSLACFQRAEEEEVDRAYHHADLRSFALVAWILWLKRYEPNTRVYMP